MSKIFIFGFDQYYPQGGLRDLLCTLDDTCESLTDANFLLQPHILQEVVQHHTLCDYYQVLQFTESGGPLLLEDWKRVLPGHRAPTTATPAARTIALHPAPLGHLVRVAVTSEFGPDHPVSA